MKSFFFFICAILFSNTTLAADFCKKQNEVDIEFPAGLIGTYELIGREPISNRTYSGSLTITSNEKTYLLDRKIAGKQVKGEAWIELCGTDRIMQFVMLYKTKPTSLMLRCALGNDGNNYFNISCHSKFIDPKSKQYGLEALFQKHE